MSGLLYKLLAGGISMAQIPPPNPLFDQDAVQQISLTFQQPDWLQQLSGNYTPNESGVTCVQASYSWGNYQFAPVGVSFKGSTSYNDATINKAPFRIKFDAFVPGQQIAGICTVVLNNAWDDPGFVREKPYYELAAAAGLPSPRWNIAALDINRVHWGLDILDEAVDINFLTNSQRIPSSRLIAQEQLQSGRRA
jgi:spore coat protein H